MRFRTLPLVVAGLVSFGHLTSYAQSGVEPVAAFPIGPGNSSQAPLYLHPDGNFYGTAGGGAFIQTNDPAPAGTLFKVTPSGQFDWMSFSGNSGSLPGAVPINKLTPSSDGWLWGMTSSGGVGSSLGTTFRMRPATGEHQVMASASFSASLTPDGTGWLWGGSGNGIYKIHEGTGQRVTVIAAFNGASAPYKGTGPGELYFDGTQFWGTTSSSGTYGGGTVFRFTPQSAAPYFTNFTTVGEFTSANVVAGSPDGFWPTGRLTPDGLGYLWGATRQSGSGGTSYGTLFKVNLATGATETVVRFNGAIKGSYPRGSLVPDGEGFLWGVTEQGGNAGFADEGTIFKIEAATGTLTTVVNISSLTGADAGIVTPQNPLMNDGHGYMWGMTSGNTSATGWSLYKVAIDTGAFTKVAEGPTRGFMPRGIAPMAPLNGEPENPWLYGTTTGGGKSNQGTLFRHNPTTGDHETLAHFTGNSGSAIGVDPRQRLHFHTDGTVWGSTRAASTYGSIFKYKPSTKTFTHVLAFTGESLTGNPGQEPAGLLATGNDNYIWGVTARAGNQTYNSNGTLFKINPATGLMTLVKAFVEGNSPDGGRPEGGLAADAQGVIWGTTWEGGGVSGAGEGYGTIFKINPSTGVFTSVIKFTNATGAYPGMRPDGDIFFDAEGKLWGKSSLGVFKFDTATNVLTYPTGAELAMAPVQLNDLYLHNDGFLYGVQNNGGTDPEGKPAGGGMIYRLRPGYPIVLTGGVNSGSDDPYPTTVGVLGSVTLNGSSGSYEFEWGPTTALGRTTPASTTATATGVTATATLPTLSGLTAYYYRLKMNGSGGPYYGPLRSMKTRQDNGVTDATEIQVDSPIGMPLVDNTTGANWGAVRVGQSYKQAVVVRNLGTYGLTGLTATISGPDAALFTVSSPLSAGFITAKYDVASLFVTYAPDAAATHSATLTITNNDSNEAPFEVLLTGTGVIEPDLRVEQPEEMELLADRRGSVEFGSLDLNDSAYLAFTVRNTGNGELTGISASIIGDHASEFVLSEQPPESLDADGSATFDITFTPTVHGLRTAILKIESNDPDEDPYEILLVGAGVGVPLIKVVQQVGGQEVVSEEGVPYGNVSIGFSVSKTFVIQNVGTAPLVISSTTFTGGMFTLISPPTGTIDPGETTTIVIAFTPTHAILQQPTYTIPSNAENNPSFKLKVVGFGVNDIPDIKVGQGFTEYADGSSVSFGGAVHPNTVEKSLDITNTGPGTITGISASFAPGSSSAFKITQAPASSVAQGAFTGITLTYKPTANGAQTATLRIASSDANENPYDIILNGVGINVPAPEIAIEEGVTTLQDDSGTVAMGVVPFGSTPAAKTFTIRNSGTGPLTGISAGFEAGSSADFKVTKAPGASVAVGATTTFTVTYKPTVNGAATATLLVASSDSDETPFDIHFTASSTGAPEPEIGVEVAAVPLTDGGSYGFPAVAAHLTDTKVFTIRNTGAAGLTGVSVGFAGGSSSAFALVTPPVMATTVAKNASTTFAVRFTPGGIGTFNAVLRIASNDANENPFDINLSGTGQATLAPLFTVPPQSQLKLLGTSAQFEPTVTGTGNTYQWKKNGTNVTNATNRVLQFTTKTADVGAYTLFAKNAAGENTSRPAYLGLVTLSQGTLNVKETGTFTLNCTAAAPAVAGVSLTYQWRLDGDPLMDEAGHIAGAGTKTLKLTNATLNDSGNYTCFVVMDTPYGQESCANGDTMVNVVQKPTITPFMLSDAVVGETIGAPSFPPVSANFAATFTATNLPPGVVLDKNTGAFSGKPTTPKIVAGAVVPYAVKFTATNPAGTSDAVTVNWTILALDPSLIGTFNGLVDRDPYTNFGFGGTIQLTTTVKGAITGSVTLAGQKYPVTGVLDATEGNNPSATIVVKRTPAAMGDLKLTITSIEIDGDRLSGTISDDQFDLLQGGMAVGNGEAGSVVGDFGDVRLNGPSGIALQGEGGFISDTNNHVIRKVAEEQVITFAGLPETSGNADGTGGDARFNLPEGIALDAAGNLWVADTGNGAVRKITPLGVVTTLAAPAGTFVSPCALAFDNLGNMAVVDRGNHTIRKVAPNGTITILAGKPGVNGHKDGGGATALFKGPRGITYDATLKAFFVTDTGNRVIRKILPTGAVSTYAGSPGIEGQAGGLLANARFIEPIGIASDGLGTLVVSDSLLVKITPGGIVATISEYVDDVGFTDRPVAIAYDAEEGGVLAADSALHSIVSFESMGPVPSTAFVARRNIWSTAAPVPAARVGNYTAGIATTQLADPAYPQGHGYATLAVTKTGMATWGGKTADGATITFATTVGPEGDIMLHQMLYKNTGSIQGLTFVDDMDDWYSANGVDTPFDWYKVAQPTAVVDRVYKSGFVLHPVTLTGGKYTPANNVFAFLDIAPATTTANATATFSEGGLSADFTQSIDVKAPSAVTVPTTGNPNVVKLTVTASSGLFTGSFNQGTPARKAAISGVLLRNTTNNFKGGRGHFLLPQDTTATSPQLSGDVLIEAN